MNEFKIKRGDQCTVNMQVNNNDWTPVDLTWVVVKFAVSTAPNRSWTILIEKTIEDIASPTLWVAPIPLASSDTDYNAWSYYWEAELTFTNWDIRTTSIGSFIINNDIINGV